MRLSIGLGALLALMVFVEPSCAQVVKLERLSPSRNIVSSTILSPITLRIRAVDGEGKPVAGARIMAAVPASDPGLPSLQDQFGFKGFNIPRSGVGYCGEGLPLDAFFATTNALGIAEITPPLVSTQAGSGFPIVARLMKSECEGALPSVQAYFPTVVSDPPLSNSASVVVEYFNAPLDQYFSTLFADEIEKLDAGAFVGWAQSIGAFAAYPSATLAPTGTVPVCRFWNRISSAHFYTADESECEAVERLYPDTWILETTAAFWIYKPNTQTGACGANQLPIHRMYNNKANPGHRYITDPRLRDWMIGAGWIAEGFGQEAVMMCAPR